MEQTLYQLPEGWEWKNLLDVARIGAERGFTPVANEEGLVPFIGMSNIDQETGLNSSHEYRDFKSVKSGYTKFQRNAVLVAKITPCTENNKTALISELDGGYATTEVYPVHCLCDIEPSYLLHFFRSPSVRSELISKMEGATGRQRVPVSALNLLTVPLPSLTEQKHIVTKLDALFTRIDSAIEQLQQTLKLSQALFASALVEVFSDQPNWRRSKVKDIFHVINGRAYKRPELLGQGKYKVVRIQNLKGGKSYYYSDMELADDKYCESGDLLFSWSGTPGTSFGAFIWEGEKAIFHYHIWNMKPLVEIDIRFAYWLLRDLTEEAIAGSRGVAGMLHITKGMMEAFEVAIPSTIEEQREIAKRLDSLSENTRALEEATQEKLDYLKSLKASLLDAAFCGQL